MRVKLQGRKLLFVNIQNIQFYNCRSRFIFVYFQGINYLRNSASSYFSYMLKFNKTFLYLKYLTDHLL